MKKQTITIHSALRDEINQDVEDMMEDTFKEKMTRKQFNDFIKKNKKNIHLSDWKTKYIYEIIDRT